MVAKIVLFLTLLICVHSLRLGHRKQHSFTEGKCIFHREHDAAIARMDFGVEADAQSPLCDFDDSEDCFYHQCTSTRHRENGNAFERTKSSCANLPHCREDVVVHRACSPAGQALERGSNIPECEEFYDLGRHPKASHATFSEDGGCCNGEFDDSCKAASCTCDALSYPVTAVKSLMASGNLFHSADARMALKNKTITFVGDSTTRRLIYAFAAFLGEQNFWDRHGATHHDILIPEHGFSDTLLGDHGIHLNFKWAPMLKDLHAFSNDESLARSDFIITTSFHWDVTFWDTSTMTSSEQAEGLFNWGKNLSERTRAHVVLVAGNILGNTDKKDRSNENLEASQASQALSRMTSSMSGNRLSFVGNEWMMGGPLSQDRHTCLGHTKIGYHIRFETGQFLRVQSVLAKII